MCIGLLEYACGYRFHFNVLDDLSDNGTLYLATCCKGSGCKLTIFYGYQEKVCGREACWTCQGNNNVGKGPPYYWAEQPKLKELEGTPEGFDLDQYLEEQGFGRSGGEDGGNVALFTSGQPPIQHRAGRMAIPWTPALDIRDRLPGPNGPDQGPSFRFINGGGPAIYPYTATMNELRTRQEEVARLRQRAREAVAADASKEAKDNDDDWETEEEGNGTTDEAQPSASGNDG